MATAKDIDLLLESFVERGLPGCALKVMQRGNSLYEGYFGYTDLASGVPVTKDSLFRQASMSKIPLYTAMMLLYEQGNSCSRTRWATISRSGRKAKNICAIPTAMWKWFPPDPPSPSGTLSP